MVLKKVVREKVVEYFHSPGWRTIMETLSRGHRDVLHAHIYLDSIMHPSSMLEVASIYFEKQGLKMARKVPTISIGQGHSVLYYLQPGDLCHFEFFFRFNDEVVVEPATLPDGRKANEFDFWDRAGMEKYYEKFSFARMDQEGENLVRAFYQGDQWEELIYQLAYQSHLYGHAHCNVDTKYHPEDLLRLGVEAIEARGWEVGRAVSIIYNQNGREQGKVSFLLQKPQIVLELEYNNRPDVTIKPMRHPVTRTITYDDVRKDLAGIPYFRLDSDDLRWVAENLPGKG